MFSEELVYFLSLLTQASAQIDYSQYVNPFIGAEGPISGYAFGGGDVFVGGAVPFGVAKVGLDTPMKTTSLSQP